MSSIRSVDNLFATLFNPALESWKRGRDQGSHDKSFAALALVEAYGWTRLGVQTNAFPRSNAQDYVRANVFALQQALAVVEQSGLLDQGILSLTQQSLTRQNFPPAFLESHPNEFDAFPEAATTFIVSCAECCNFARSIHASAFVQKLSSAYLGNWQSVIRQLLDENFDEAGVDVVSLFEGYLISLQHLNRIAALLSEYEVEPQKQPALAVLRVEIGRIHRWRLNLGQPYYHDRFEEATEIVENRLRSEASQNGTHLQSGGFLQAVEDIIRRYVRSFGYLSATA